LPEQKRPSNGQQRQSRRLSRPEETIPAPAAAAKSSKTAAELNNRFGLAKERKYTTVGFGLLCIGYLFFLFLYGFEILVPSCLIMSLGLKKLSVYDRNLYTAYLTNYILLIGGLLSLILTLAEGMLGASSWIDSATLRSTLAIALWLALAFFYFKLFTGIMELAAETGLAGIRARAYRNRIFSVGYSLLRMPLELTLPTAVLRVAVIPALIVGFIVTFLNISLIYSCYMQICRPEDIERDKMPEKDGLLAKMKKWRDSDTDPDKK
jgi:hypothetical protein